MTDRELLELAAKAAGVKASNYPDGIWRNTTDMHPSMNFFGAPRWNPLTDDGDALRLAVKLGIDLFICGDGRAIATAPLHGGGESRQVEGNIGAAPYAATRRAIVRAAAEIGRQVRLPQDCTPAS